MPEAALLVFVGALAGGTVSGLTGFGTGLVTLPIWLLAVAPVRAAPLVVICSVVAQLQTLPAIWHAIDRRRLAPFLLGGAVGVPIGTRLLPLVPLATFKAGLGVLLVLVCGSLLLARKQPRFAQAGRWADGAVGFGGGLLGGLAGLSGPLPTLWAGLRGWGKDERRAVFQSFNLGVLLLAGISMALAGLMTPEVARLAVAALPGTLIGAWAGRRLYGRLDVVRFDRIVLVVLAAAGVAMILGAR